MRSGPGEVEVRFVEHGPSETQVHVTHSGFDRHGEGGDGYRAAMADQGWPYILERFSVAQS